MNKILIVDNVHPLLKQQLEKNGFTCSEDLTCSKEILISSLENCQGLVVRSRFSLDKEMLSKMSHLRFIARVGSGLEHIDVDYAKSLGIAVLSSPEGNASAVAEHVIAVILALFRKLNLVKESFKTQQWNRIEFEGIELKNKTVGIIGYGNTGGALAKLLTGFGANVLAHDKYKTGFSTEGIEESSLENIQSCADILSIHLPLSLETENYVNTSFIQRMRNQFYLINTSRGKHLNIKDVIEGLEKRKILGACIDVLPYESYQFDIALDLEKSKVFNFLAKSNRVVLTPHVAGITKESALRLAHITASKIIDL